MQKPPPIQWLITYEAAARHRNFKHAAKELFVSPSAVSQQIKVLEDYLGIPLFDRSRRQLTLTEAGEFYAKQATNIITQHTNAFRQFERRFLSPSLHISAPIFIAQELLIPNYTSFNDYAPDIDLRITTGNEYINFDSDPLDAALRFGPGDWSDLDCRFLTDVEPQLVCSPDYLSRERLSTDKPLAAEDLQQHTLVSIFDDLRDWRDVMPDVVPDKKIICDSYFSAIRSVEAGLGIGVGLKPVINKLLDQERLKILATRPLSTDYAYWLVSPHDRASHHIDALYQWLKSLFDSLR